MRWATAGTVSLPVGHSTLGCPLSCLSALCYNRQYSVQETQGGRRAAMPVAQSQIVIAAPPEAVWALISDLERGPEWSLVTLECRLTSPGPIGLGSTYRAASRFAASRITTEHEIVEWDSPHRLVSRVTRGAESLFTQLCEPVDEGTVLTMVNEFALPRGVPKLVSDRLAQQVSKTLSEELTRIKEVVEERHRAANAEGTQCSSGQS